MCIRDREKAYKQDPVTFMTNSFSQGSFGGSGGGMRMQIDPNDRKQMEDRLRDEVKKNNNPIEFSK